jgi:hypothetical protein
MAVKNKLEVVPSLPTQPKPDLEDLLASRLADDLIADVDMGKLTKLAIAHLGNRLKSRFIDWLSSDNSQRVALTEVDAIEAASEEVAA